MTGKSPNLDSNFNLRPFQDGDYEGLAVLRNLLYPQHPLSIKSMIHAQGSVLDRGLGGER